MDKTITSNSIIKLNELGLEVSQSVIRLVEEKKRLDGDFAKKYPELLEIFTEIQVKTSKLSLAISEI